MNIITIFTFFLWIYRVSIKKPKELSLVKIELKLQTFAA